MADPMDHERAGSVPPNVHDQMALGQPAQACFGQVVK